MCDCPLVHGEGDHGFISILIGIAREKGMSAYVGEGRNRWTAAHRLDAGTLYRLALKKGTTGSRFHGVAEERLEWKPKQKTLLADLEEGTYFKK